jgi:hypothetical protein
MKTREEAKRKAWQLILAMEVRNLSDTFDVAMAMYDWLNTQPDANTEPLIHNRSFEDEVRDQLGHRLNNTPPTAVPNESGSYTFEGVWACPRYHTIRPLTTNNTINNETK